METEKFYYLRSLKDKAEIIKFKTTIAITMTHRLLLRSDLTMNETLNNPKAQRYSKFHHYKKRIILNCVSY